MSTDLGKMLGRIKDRQWALADIDWAAPGADRIRPDQRDGLQSFMSDVTWIEQVGSRAFAALARSATDPVLADIYRYFQAEEQRHANAELALMRRWGMVETGGVPTPNPSIRLAMKWLDRFADGLPLAVLATAIPMLEVALDGALLKFLVDEVDDPLCGQVFDKINNDESRHLAVGYHVLEVLGRQPRLQQFLDLGKTIFSPAALAVLPAGLPLMSKARDSVIAMGLDERQLYDALARFDLVGVRTPVVRRNPAYLGLKEYGKMVADRSHPYHRLGDALVWLTDRIPQAALPQPPSWISGLTAEPAVG
ncbi:MAG TPA: ferritin-like domain-containing protein [Acidimicrobiales bacterium]|jgi:hypothetical protein|nr:ferritin-like domain-containing protein [Acidimicrobiales bacterium]